MSGKGLKILAALIVALAVILVPAHKAAAAVDYDPVYYDYAVKLWELGVFLGSDGSFKLDQQLTRAEGAVMIVRLLGTEQEAKKIPYRAPFTDVPEWAKPAVNYLYQNGYTKGQSESKFGSNNIMTENEYLTLVFRALGYKDGVDFTWDKAADAAYEKGLILKDTHGLTTEYNFFFRDAAAYASYQALYNVPAKAGGKLIDKITVPGNPGGKMPIARDRDRAINPQGYRVSLDANRNFVLPGSYYENASEYLKLVRTLTPIEKYIDSLNLRAGYGQDIEKIMADVVKSFKVEDDTWSIMRYFTAYTDYLAREKGLSEKTYVYELYNFMVMQSAGLDSQALDKALRADCPNLAALLNDKLPENMFLAYIGAAYGIHIASCNDKHTLMPGTACVTCPSLQRDASLKYDL